MPDLPRICRITGKPFAIDEVQQFVMSRLPELNPVLGVEPLPAPDVHPFELLRRIYSFGALRKLYRAKSVVSGKTQLTRYDPSLGTKICTYEEFFSDEVDNTARGREYDFSRPFFEQLRDLFYDSILPPLNRRNCEDSEYVNGGENLNRCYLCFAAFESQDCLYCLTISRCRDCISCVNCSDCELCYECRDLTRCYELENSSDCTDCHSCFGCVDCRSCTECFGCCGLERASHRIFNQAVTKDEYQRFLSELQLHTWSGRVAAIGRCSEFVKSLNHSVGTFVDCSNATGAYLSRCENVIHCYNGYSSTNCGYLIISQDAHYCYYGLGRKSEFNFMSHAIGSSMGAYSYAIFGGEGNIYSMFLMHNCSHCFGSVALRSKSYCILNKQYSREEYVELVPQIIAHMRKTGEWGQWYPLSMAAHSYQESSVHEFLSQIPLSTARERGYRVSDDEVPEPGPGAVDASRLPDELLQEHISGLVSKSIVCSRTRQLFNFQKRELDEYLRRGIPLPRIHWNERLQDFLNERVLIPAI